MTKKAQTQKNVNQLEVIDLKIEVTPKTRNQNFYLKNIYKNDLVICTGPAGTGKTHLAVGAACRYLKNNDVDKILITRPLVQCGRGLGFLPGNVDEKVNPYMRPLIDELELFLGFDQLRRLMIKGTIQIEPLELLQGRNLHRTFMILDECQNATYEQLKMFATRIGHDSKCVMSGDIKQANVAENLSAFTKNIGELDGFNYSKLTLEDVQRSGFVGKLLTRLEENE